MLTFESLLKHIEFHTAAAEPKPAVFVYVDNQEFLLLAGRPISAIRQINVFRVLLLLKGRSGKEEDDEGKLLIIVDNNSIGIWDV